MGHGPGRRRERDFLRVQLPSGSGNLRRAILRQDPALILKSVLLWFHCLGRRALREESCPHSPLGCSETPVQDPPGLLQESAAGC